MLNTAHFLIGTAWADTPAAAPHAGGLSSMMGPMGPLLPLILIFLVFYVLIIRPQNKKLQEQDKMIKALKRGDRVVTAGGICGKIVRPEGDDHLIVEIADGVQAKIVRTTVQSLVAKTEPAADAAGKKD
ncbi:MAG TPA: preprotein translocase subunit YajC [Alphaproteobacteria bacterium]|jgi:preprotein translocase subunit YajC|nr:preprotein translocase subunit YajC [Alphaproteobacteria bacterium]